MEQDGRTSLLRHSVRVRGWWEAFERVKCGQNRPKELRFEMTFIVGKVNQTMSELKRCKETKKKERKEREKQSRHALLRWDGKLKMRRCTDGMHSV